MRFPARLSYDSDYIWVRGQQDEEGTVIAQGNSGSADERVVCLTCIPVCVSVSRDAPEHWVTVKLYALS